MRILQESAAASRVKKITARASSFEKVGPTVKRVIADVRRNGDRALRKYAERWDGLEKEAHLRVPEEAMQHAWESASPDLKRSLQAAAANIRRFCEKQKPREWTRSRNGISAGQIVRPLNSVGCYVPGGRYPLVSTLLMTVIPAQVAGVENIRLASPQPHAAVLAAAAMLEIRELYAVGGAQAIAALAYGTENIPRVDKIVGPGNLYVTAAKKQVAFDCSIDFLAGPTEVVIVSNSGTPAFIAADLVAQAEHDPEALTIFITTSIHLAQGVASGVKGQSRGNPVAQESLRRNGAILLASSLQQSFAWANAIAPEHLTIERRSHAALVQNAGSVFIGDYSAQAAGDYASGPNHVLPTAGAARFRGGLSVLDFVKLISIQELSRPGLKQIAPHIDLLATTEGLTAHSNSVRRRIGTAAIDRKDDKRA